MTSMERLENIKEKIEKMNVSYQIEILKLLVKENASISENNNGSFLNLSDLDINILDKLDEYINFVYKQQNQLKSDESIKDDIKDKFFALDGKKNNITKQNKDELSCILNGANY